MLGIVGKQQPKKVEPFSRFNLLPLEPGKRKVKSVQPEQSEVSEDITSKSILVKKGMNPREISSMQGSLPGAKKKTWRDKLSSYSNSTQIMKLLKISDQVLTSRGGVLKPWWSTSSREKSRNLWLPTEIDSPVLGSNSSNLSSSKQIHQEKSWYSMTQTHPQNKNLQMTYSPSLQSSLLECMDSGVTKPNSRKSSKVQKPKKPQKEYKTIKIRILPTESEKGKIKKLCEIFRWYYNCTLNIINLVKVQEPGLFKSFFVGCTMSYMKLRDHISRYEYEESATENMIFKFFTFTPDSKSLPLPTWWKKSDVHNRVPRGAVKSFTQNYNSAASNWKNGNISGFELKYKSKKALSEECLFEDKSYPSWLRDISSQYFHNHKRVDTQKLLKNHPSGLVVYHDLVKEKYYLHLPVEVVSEEIHNENQGIISLDTGVRTFQTGYSPNGHILEIGKNDYLTLEGLLRKTDILQGKYLKTRNGKYRDKRLKIFRRIKNLVSDLHWKVIHYLTTHYNTVIIPDFRIGGMVKQKKLGRMTKRLLYMFSYYQFKERLLWKAKTRGVQVLVVDESFTSKTCGNCGWQNQRLEGSKIFQCKECGLVIDRDHNGARNILLKHL